MATSLILLLIFNVAFGSVQILDLGSKDITEYYRLARVCHLSEEFFNYYENITLSDVTPDNRLPLAPVHSKHQCGKDSREYLLFRLRCYFGFSVLLAYVMHILIEAPCGGLKSLLLPNRRPDPQPKLPPAEVIIPEVTPTALKNSEELENKSREPKDSSNENSRPVDS